jgi:hypothetical protein
MGGEVRGNDIDGRSDADHSEVVPFRQIGYTHLQTIISLALSIFR